MKAKLLAKALDMLLENPQWRKKLKTIAIVGIVGLFLTGGLVIWAGFSAAKYVAREMGQHLGPAIESTVSQGTVLQGVASGVGVVASVERCWTNVQGIMESENLVAEGISSGVSGVILSFKNACFGAEKSVLPKSQPTSEEVI
jgi:hypothetical protein